MSGLMKIFENYEGRVMQRLPKVLGTSVSSDDPPAYVVTVTSSATQSIVRALLQEDFSLHTSSSWAPFSFLSLIPEIVKEAAQVANVALTNRLMTRRYWQGSEPLSFSLPLKFVARYDSEREVVLPVLRLLQLALPSAGGQEVFGRMLDTIKKLPRGAEAAQVLGSAVVVPPGPNPFADSSITQLAAKTIGEGYTPHRGDVINIKIGTMLEFTSVVVSDVSGKLFKKFDRFGLPIEAEVTLTFETFSMSCKEDLFKMFSGVFGKYDTQQQKWEQINRAGNYETSNSPEGKAINDWMSTQF